MSVGAGALGLDDTVVRGLVEAVSADAAASIDGAVSAGAAAGADLAGGLALEPPVLEDRFARGVFTLVAEPGDRAAGLLLRALGPHAALRCLVRRAGAASIAAQAGDPVDRAALAALLPEALERWRPRLRARDAVAAFEHAAALGAHLVIPGDGAWLPGLDDLGDHAPAALWVRGDPAHLAQLSPAVAVVGARAATSYGTHVAAELAAGLADRGVAVVSGAAYGIDGMAHRAALASGGLTVAFLAGGADRLYPAGHAELLGRIIHDGCVVAEMPCGAAPTRWRFLQRNRLIAAASAATVVVEAGNRSGSLNTAGHAAQLGRALGAVPGPVTSPASAGCHRLVREYDARLVTGPGDVAELLGLDAAVPAGSSAGPPDASGDGAGTRMRVVDALDTRARAVDDLARRSGMAPAQVQAALGILELAGAAVRRGDAWVRGR